MGSAFRRLEAPRTRPRALRFPTGGDNIDTQELSQKDMEKMQEDAIRQAKAMQEKVKSENIPQEKTENIKTEPNGKKTLGSIGNILNMDKDKAIILPLLLLLGKEGGDNILLLALMYIMS